MLSAKWHATSEYFNIYWEFRTQALQLDRHIHAYELCIEQQISARQHFTQASLLIQGIQNYLNYFFQEQTAGGGIR